MHCELVHCLYAESMISSIILAFSSSLVLERGQDLQVLLINRLTLRSTANTFTDFLNIFFGF
jgi:hypothetical protein